MVNKNISVRFPLIALAMLTLLAALWAGWIRLGWPWPAGFPALTGGHGALMVSSFLGTLIALERAVALRQRWMYLGPLLSALGGLTLMLGLPFTLGAGLIVLASLSLVAVLGIMVHRVTALYTWVMATGALAWLAGNLLWFSGWPVHRVVLWWAGFLILTIAGERLELGRLLRLSRRVESTFLVSTVIFLLGALLSLLNFSWGWRVSSLGMLSMSVWLLRYDISRRTVRQKQLPRFAAICLLAGYVWLGLSGLLGIYFGGASAGPVYDALLHTIFLGFVMSMIFGHAPIIFPAVLSLPISYTPLFYLHLILMHVSLGIRVSADLAGSQPARLYGGLFNGIAILLFLAATAVSMTRAARIEPIPEVKAIHKA